MFLPTPTHIRTELPGQCLIDSVHPGYRTPRVPRGLLRPPVPIRTNPTVRPEPAAPRSCPADIHHSNCGSLRPEPPNYRTKDAPLMWVGWTHINVTLEGPWWTLKLCGANGIANLIKVRHTYSKAAFVSANKNLKFV